MTDAMTPAPPVQPLPPGVYDQLPAEEHGAGTGDGNVDD